MNNKIDKPFTLSEKIKAYLYFLWKSRNRHGVHSPFVFDFIEHVANKYYKDEIIEEERKRLKNDYSIIDLKDFGTGANRRTSVWKIARSSLKSPKEAALIAKITSYYKINEVIELGCSLGITSAYIARSHPSINVKTIEGSESVLEIAKNVWQRLGLKNIESFKGDFNSTIPSLFPLKKDKTLVFIDGNHRYSATMNYFKTFKQECNRDVILIFDDIHWSEGMELAWESIKNDNDVSLSIDLFELGIVFLNPRLKKEHFIIRY